MKLKVYLIILSFCLVYFGFGRDFNAEKLIGKWISKQGMNVQIWTFKDASHLHVYSKLADPGHTADSRYRLEKETSAKFVLVLRLRSDHDKKHEIKDKCIWLNDNQFNIIDSPNVSGMTFIFTRSK